MRASRAWATNSWHEHELVNRWCAADAHGAVMPLPVLRAGGPEEVGPEAFGGRVPTAPVLGVFGFVYPGKGHRQVVRAAAALRRAG